MLSFFKLGGCTWDEHPKRFDGGVACVMQERSHPFFP